MRGSGSVRRGGRFTSGVSLFVAAWLAVGIVAAPAALAVATASVGDATVTEGNSGSTLATFTVTFSEANSTDTTVTYETYPISAQADVDYTHTSGTLTFVAGDTSETVSVPVLGDLLDEPNETFGLALRSISNGNFGSDTTGTGSILDDDAAPGISIADASITEGNTGTKTVTTAVSLSAPSSNYISVDFATADGTATFSPGGDFHSTSGRLVFEPGDTSETITLTVVSDTTAERDETFVVNLTNPVDATIADAQGVITIVNDDSSSAPPGGLPTLSVGAAQVTEGDSGTVQTTVPVTLSAPSSDHVTVDFTTSPGTATFSGADYHQTSGRLVFAPGETSKSILVTIVSDTTVENDESFFVDLSEPTNATLASSRGTVTIANDDTTSTPPPPPSGTTPQVSIGDATVVEGDADETRIAVVVSLSQASSSSIAVSFASADGTALFSDADYWQTTGRLVFSPGQTSQTIIATVVGDTRVEPNEVFYVDLSAPSGASLGKSRSAVSITNDDSSTTPPPGDGTPEISIGDVSVQEGDSGTALATVILSLSASSSRPVGVSLTTVDGSATFDEADYWSTSGTLVFQPGETTRALELTVNGDTEAEGDEAFFVDLSNPQNATISKARGVITILDDEAPNATDTTLRVFMRTRRLTALGEVVPPRPGERMKVVLRKRKAGRFKTIATRRPVLSQGLDGDGDGTFGSSYEATFRRPRRGACLIKAVYPASESHAKSVARTRFRC